MKIKNLFKGPIFKILCFILNNPTKEFYEKEVAERTGVSLGACHKYMKKLSDLGFLFREKRGRMNFYKLNREDPLIKQLKVTFTLDSSLVDDMKKLRGDRVEVFLYGSFARGEDVEDSDFDLLLLAPPQEQSRIATILRRIGAKHGKRVTVTSFTRGDWIEMKKKDPAFYERVERDKVRLV